jgi:preprotein translocase subunit YajC
MSGFGFLLIILAFVFLYFVLVRPQKRRQVAQQRMLEAMQVGDEVLTAGGIYGEIAALDEDEVRLRVAPAVEVRVARRAVAAILTDHDAGEVVDETEDAPDGAGREPPVETEGGYPTGS